MGADICSDQTLPAVKLILNEVHIMSDDKLYQVLADVLDIKPDSISEDSSPESIASWDSLNHLNVVMALDIEFDIRLSLDEAVALRNVGSIRATLRNHGVEV